MSNNFHRINSSEYKTDPVFLNDKFEMYGSAVIPNCPLFFCIDNYRYILITPSDINANKALAFKIATYLYHHETMLNENPIIYFFGDINKCKEIGNSFTNQIRKYISYEMIEEWYPKNISEINNYVINYFLNKQQYYGQEFQYFDYDLSYLLFIPKYLGKEAIKQSENFMRSQLFSKGYFKQVNHYDDKLFFVITEYAIERFQKAKEKDNSKQAFIALKFAYNQDRIQAIQNAISECGFTPCDMTEHQTNNWIMPEIFHQIQLSKFVVVDLSLRCDGAYYEAGYAHALGKEVIHLYDEREKETNPLHFDVSQKSTVMYNDLDDLKSKLIKRIKATIK